MDAVLGENVMRRFCVGDLIRRAALNKPNNEVLVNNYKGKVTRTITLGELNKEANRFANAIMKLGIKKGDKVAIISHNCVQYVDFIVALSKMGAWITPLNFALKGREIIPLINHSEVSMLIVEDSLVDTIMEVKDELQSVKNYVMINLSQEKSLPEGWLDFDDLCSDKYSDEEPYVGICGDDVLTLMYTSGTEAMPKGVLNSHSNWYASLMNMAFDFGHLTLPGEEMGLGVAPLFHVAGHCTLLSSLAQGRKTYMLYTPDPGVVMRVLQSENITSAVFAPTVMVNMLNMPNGEKLLKKLFSSVRMCMLYGSPTTEAMMKRIMDLLPGVYWQNYYGQSELTPLGTTLKSPDLLRKLKEANERFGGAEAIGQSHAMVEMKIFDENNVEVPPGTVGEMVARSPATMLGYYKEEEKTKNIFKDGWHHTGDLGIMDEERFFYFVDRKKDVIKTGAENVSSIEVEGWVAKHEKVSECAAVGFPHDRWGEAVVIFVSPKPGKTISEDEIIAHCKTGLAGYKVPKKVIFLDDIPKNPGGKFLKRDLRKEFKDVFSSIEVSSR